MGETVQKGRLETASHVFDSHCVSINGTLTERASCTHNAFMTGNRMSCLGVVTRVKQSSAGNGSDRWIDVGMIFVVGGVSLKNGR